MLPLPLLLKTILLLALTASSLGSAMADDDGDERHWWNVWGKSSKNSDDGDKNNRGSSRATMRTSAPPEYQKECSSCHMAYPAGLLPAGSWQHLMGSLGKHFGSDASLDAASANAITQYLTSQAGTYKRVSEMPPQDRITESNWFQRKHNKHVSPGTFARASIGGPANCAACHQGAEQGDFNEHSVRIPN
jgi:hypothetical protein